MVPTGGGLPETVAAALVRPLTTSRDQTGQTLSVGDRVQARYKGKGTRYYPGRISAASRIFERSDAM